MPLRYIRRTIEEVVRSRARQFAAVAVSGPRQSGKSTLLKNLFQKTHKYVSFDDPLMREQAQKDPESFLDRHGEPLILDEIQYVPEITSRLKLRIDAERGRTGRYLLTGSQKFAVIRNLGDSLAGRIALVDLLPFDLAERELAAHGRRRASSTRDAFVSTCLVGTFPETCVARVDPAAWYSSYLQTYLERDVRSLHDIGSLRDFQGMLRLLATRCSQQINMSEVAHDIGVAVTTVKRWISVLEASQLLFLLPPYYRNLGKRITKTPKLYFTDPGLVAWLAGIQTKEHLLQGPMAGALFECFCVSETIKVFSNRGRTPAISYLRTHNDLEVDLLIEGPGLELFPVECKLTARPRPAMAAPMARARALFSGLPLRDGVVFCCTSGSAALSPEATAMDARSYIAWLNALVT